MKTLASLLLALTMIFALAACGADKNLEEENTPPAVLSPEEEGSLPEDGNEGEVSEQPELPAEQPPTEDATTPTENSGNTNSTPPDGSGKPSSGTSEKPSTGGSSSTQPIQPPANNTDKPTTGDSGTGSGNANKGDLTSLMGQLLEGTEDEMTVSTETIAADAFQSNLFIDYIDGAQAVSSNALMSAVAHSVCLLQVPEGSDAAKIAAQIDANKDPRKWVCVEAEKSVVLQKGNYILLAMSTTDIVNTVSKNFKAMF